MGKKDQVSVSEAEREVLTVWCREFTIRLITKG